MTDVDGRRYLDCLAGYSALNFGHRHPRLVAAAQRQLDRVTLTSRAFEHDQFGPFCDELAELGGKDMVLPMNTGAEAVETAIKIARKWGYQVKGVPDGEAKIIVVDGNFHGRTTTIVSFSTDPDARADFGPYTPGFRDRALRRPDALAAAIDDNTVAVLIEPIQGEAGVIVPPAGYLAGVRELCTAHDVLFIADEIQSGLGRTGTTFACEHEGVVPDMYMLGKALGGGIVPVSAVVSPADVLGVLKPGEHGSTFGGNPLACAVARAVIALLTTGEFQERAAKLGAHLHDRLNALPAGGVRRYAAAACGPASTSTDADRPRGLRAAGRARRAGQGHPRLDDPARAAAGDQRGGPGLGARPGRGHRPLDGAARRGAVRSSLTEQGQAGWYVRRSTDQPAAMGSSISTELPSRWTPRLPATGANRSPSCPSTAASACQSAGRSSRTDPSPAGSGPDLSATATNRSGFRTDRARSRRCSPCGARPAHTGRHRPAQAAPPRPPGILPPDRPTAPFSSPMSTSWCRCRQRTGRGSAGRTGASRSTCPARPRTAAGSRDSTDAAGSRRCRRRPASRRRESTRRPRSAPRCAARLRAGPLAGPCPDRRVNGQHRARLRPRQARALRWSRPSRCRQRSLGGQTSR